MRIAILLLMLATMGNVEQGTGNQQVLERTLALVGGQAITLTDVRAALALGLVDAGAALPSIPALTAQLVDRELMLREVQRYAPAPPSESSIGARMDEIRARFRDAGALSRALDRYGFTEVRLRAWVRDDLRTQAYLAQRFAAASTPTESEISAAYSRARAEFDQSGVTFEQATPVLRERLVAARRAELISDWLADLRRRTDVIILQQ